MSRSRHRLTRLRDATINTPSTSTEGNFDAWFDADTYTRHVAGPIDVTGLAGATGHTGSTSDAYLAAAAIAIQGDYNGGGYLYIGAANDADSLGGDNSGVVEQTSPSASPERWPWEYPGSIGYGADGAIASQARRAYFFCDLNNYGPPLQAGDEITSATMVLTISNDHGYNTGQWIGKQDPNTGEQLPLPELYTCKNYCAYKVLQGITPGNFDDINWWGFSGDTTNATYWESAGGSSYGVDIDDLGISACSQYCHIESADKQNQPQDPGGGGFGGKIGRFFGNSGLGRTLRFDITHLVQDAISNESGILKVAVYRELDTSLARTTYNYESDANNTSGKIYYYYDWTNAISVYSSDYTSTGDDFEFAKPRIEVSYIRRT